MDFDIKSKNPPRQIPAVGNQLLIIAHLYEGGGN